MRYIGNDWWTVVLQHLANQEKGDECIIGQRACSFQSKLTLSQPFPLSRERVNFVSLLISCPFVTSFHYVMRV